MSIPILIFEPIDLPPDIKIIVNDTCSFYVFTKITADNTIYFTIEQSSNSLMESKELTTDFKKTGVILFKTVYYLGNNVNEYLWKISDCNYGTRYSKLEIIERLRCCNNPNDIKKILMYIRQIPIDTQSDGEDLN
jgi:hypothetical protein